jgi:hypothetical protein
MMHPLYCHAALRSCQFCIRAKCSDGASQSELRERGHRQALHRKPNSKLVFHRAAAGFDISLDLTLLR